MQRHTCQIAIQFWSPGVMILSLSWIRKGSYDGEVVLLDLDHEPISHILHGGEDLHIMKTTSTYEKAHE